jgi:hypothetical protein
VELEENMSVCPLCGTPVHADQPTTMPATNKNLFAAAGTKPISPRRKKHLWEIVSITLLSATIATLVIDFILNRHISWSEYPVAVCLVVFAYASSLAFLKNNLFVEMGSGFLLSSACLVALDALTAGISWALRLVVPLLFSTSVVIAILVSVIQRTQYQGINLVAYSLMAAAVVCMCVEGTLAFFTTRSVQLSWSAVVGLCTIPVVVTLLYMHFRLKKGRSLARTFHV